MSDSWYYDFMNIDHALSKMLVKGILPYDLHYVKEIMSTKMSMFGYEGLPGSLTSQILEGAMLFYHNLCFYKSEELGEWILCRYVIGSDFDIYMKPKSVNLIALNGSPIKYGVPYNDIILVRDNKMDIPPVICINEYLLKIKKIEDTMFKVLDIGSLPLAIVGTKKMAAQLKAIAKTMGSTNSFIVGDDAMIDAVKGFDINLKLQPNIINDLKTKYRNECVTSLGIYSADQKRERLVTQELINQNDYADFIYQDSKMERQRFIKELMARDNSLHIKFIETYKVNVEDNIDNEAEKARAIAEAEDVVEKEEK